jgi:endonuclease/exonuclease/phosphatase family metal-dependent hydrolase
MARVWLAALLVAVMGCTGPVEGPSWTGAGPVTVLSWNLAQRLDEPTLSQLAGHIVDVSPDVVAAQEVEDIAALLGSLGGDWARTDEPRSGVALLYDGARWAVEDSGDLVLGDDDDGWGERIARWALLSRTTTGHQLYVYSTHWCVTVRRDADPCDEARQVQYAEALLASARGRATGDPVVLAGDFNVFDNFEDGAPIAALLDGGYVDVYRDVDPTGDVITFMGNDWAPAGRIDYIFASAPVSVDAATIATDAYGSDHYPITATLGFE